MHKNLLTITGGFLLMLMLGSIYSYSSTIAKPLALMTGANPWMAILPFIMVTAFLGLGAFLGGILIFYTGARPLAITGALLWGAGNIISSIDVQQFGIPWVTCWYGCVGGFGVGLGYIAVVSATIRWYPDARGLFSGLAVMGFGLGSTLYGALLHFIPAATALTGIINTQPWDPTKSAAAIGPQLSTIFLLSGIVFTIVGLVGASLVFQAPKSVGADEVEHMNLGKILQTSDIWVLWMMLFMNVFAGLYVITNVGTILNTLTQAPLATIAAVYSFIAIANGFGRVIFGGLSDVMGRRKVFFLIYGLQFAGYMILDTPVASNFWIGIALITLILLCYGGGFGTMPGYVADAVGIRNFAPAYGAVLTAWGVAGIVAPLFAVYSRELHINVNAMLMPIDTMMGISMILPILVYLRVGKEKGQSLIDSSIPVVASERMSSIPHVDAPPLQPQSAPVQKQPQPTYRPAPPPEPKHPAKPRPIAPARTTAR